MFRDYLVHCLYLQKINLKRPLSRGSRFKIYFRLECRKNRGSCQNFHEIPFPEDRVLINSNHYITLQIYYDYVLIWKSGNLNESMDVNIRLQKKLAKLVPKVRLETMIVTYFRFSLFLLFFVNFNEQNTLANNN